LASQQASEVQASNLNCIGIGIGIYHFDPNLRKPGCICTLVIDNTALSSWFFFFELSISPGISHHRIFDFQLLPSSQHLIHPYIDQNGKWPWTYRLVCPFLILTAP
jgi:hypothetical protein